MVSTTLIGSLIEATWFGGDLAPPLTGRLAALAREYEAPARSRLLVAGDETLELSLVVSGRVALTDFVPGRGSLTLMTVEAGDVFGWSALVAPFTAVSTVSALEPVAVIALDGPRLRAGMEADHELAAYVRGKLLEALARRLKATRHQLLDLYGAGWAEPVYEPW
jgi:CRP/FNR family transcriptional regulator, cyclic AMP receptor protein